MAPLRRFKPGDIIIKESDIGETAYIIEKGRVEATKEKEGKIAHLGYMAAGEIFGEMSVVDDKPRNATVTAVEETTLKEIHRDEFLDTLQNDPDAAVTILKVLFNRLREADVQILQLQVARDITPPKEAEPVQIRVSLEGSTAQAAKALPENPFQISSFPFRIGRKSSDPLAHNDLTLPDSVPYQISRHHITFIQEKERVGIVDRRSTLGATVAGKRIGGEIQDPGPVFFEGQEGVLVLGTPNSPFQYKVTIHTT